MELRARVALTCAATFLSVLSWTTTVLSVHTVDLPLGHEFGPCAGTDSKPQSKLWYHDGSWWCVLPTADGNRIHELVAHHWQTVGPASALSSEADSRADVLWDGERLIVLLYGSVSQLFEFNYDTETRSYVRREGFPVSLSIPAASETAVIDQDSQGRLWITWTAERQVRVVHSSQDHRQWNFPGTLLRDEVSDDDISTVVAFGGRSMGVFWSDQARGEFAFSMRDDTDDPETWKPIELVQHGERIADDHVNAAVDRQGRVYVVTKNGAHELAAHMRDEHGQWTTRADVLDGGHGTRPIVMVSDQDARLLMLYTRWHDGLEIIAHREAPLGTLDFLDARPFMVLLGEDVRLKDVSGTKQALPSGTLMALAHARKHAWWQGWGEGVSSGRSRTRSDRLMVSRVERAPHASLALPFDEGDGFHVADASASGNNGFLGGTWSRDTSEPNWVAGISGTALHFDGQRDFVSIDDTPSLTPSGSFTIEAWVRRFAVWQNHVVLAKGAPGARSYQVRVDKLNRVEFLRDVEGGVRKHRVRSATAIEDSLWHHIACVVDLERQESRIYLDGVQIAAAPDSGVTIHTPQALYVGARVYKERLREWWSGDIDQVRLTPAVVYEADFVPETHFPTEGPFVFLSWSPPYPGTDAQMSYHVLRSMDGADFRLMTDQPLASLLYVDVPPNPGRVTYRVRPVNDSSPGPADQSLEWLPATSPPIPAPSGRPAITRR